MKLCDTCKNTTCKRKLITIQENNLLTIKCLEYEKDNSKIQGYKKQLNRTARQQDTLMKSNI
jgi:hypothetical protein